MDLKAVPELNREQEWEIPELGIAHPVLLDELMEQEWEIPAAGVARSVLLEQEMTLGQSAAPSAGQTAPLVPPPPPPLG